MTHQHDFQLNKTRKHKRPGFYFAECECGATCQASVKYGYTTFFTTGRKGLHSNVISIRVDDTQFAKYCSDRRGYRAKIRMMFTDAV